MRVLFVASECSPVVKTGGLADVVGALPRVLEQAGIAVRVLMPAYPEVLERLGEKRALGDFDDLLGARAGLVEGRTAQGAVVWALDAPDIYRGGGNPYQLADGTDRPDSYRRFGALGQAAATLARGEVLDWRPDVVHAHDWQAGLAGAYLRLGGRQTPPVVFTIHNMSYQGLFPPETIPELRLDPGGFQPDGYEFHGHVGFLKAGLFYADHITTVSPTYARELTDPDYAMGLEGLIGARREKLTGILNGIDVEVWNPESDPALALNYTRRALAGKRHCKAALECEFQIPERPDRPLFAVISRLTHQKGLDLLLEVLPGLVDRGARLVMLGSGDAGLEQAFAAAATRWPESVAVRLGYNEALAHRIQAGADAIIVPSRFEPCGLTQLCGLRYGTIPVVARTGGLADTVIDANHAALEAGCATGIQFAPLTAPALADALARAEDLFRQPRPWRRMIRNAMAHPVGWETSAQAYAALYEAMVPAAGQAP